MGETFGLDEETDRLARSWLETFRAVDLAAEDCRGERVRLPVQTCKRHAGADPFDHADGCNACWADARNVQVEQEFSADVDEVCGLGGDL